MNRTLGIIAVIWILHGWHACQREITRVIDDDQPPQLTQPITFTQITDTSAVLSVIINEPCSVSVHYRLFGSADSLHRPGSDRRQKHLIRLHPLRPDTVYHYRVELFDRYQNMTQTPPDTFRTRINPDTLLGRGWHHFENQAYAAARTSFARLLTVDTGHSEASCGIGFSLLASETTARADSLCLVFFQNALNTTPDFGDALAGLILTLYRTGDLLHCAMTFEDLRESAPDYQFCHDPLIDLRQLTCVAAIAYFNLTLFSPVQTLIDILFPTNGLDPDTPGSWVVGGETYSTYPEALQQILAGLQVAAWNNRYLSHTTGV